MNTGLLWFDDRPNVSFDQKLAFAVSHYRLKYGGLPNMCFVHPSCLPAMRPDNVVMVRSAPDVLPHHFWLGCATQ